MEDRRFIDPSNNGRAFSLDDINVTTLNAALADDRVFAELFRMSCYSGSTVAKGILPFAVDDVSAPAGVVAPLAGGVRVWPFRAFVGSRTLAATDPKTCWRDIRSATMVGSSTLYRDVSLAANASGNPRWDLVYAVVAIDSVATDTRFLKNPTSKVIAAATYNTDQVTNVTLSQVTGTPGASPAFPALPADAGSSYNIPLAYVRVANGFSGATTVHGNELLEIAPILNIARSTGAQTVRPASFCNDTAGAMLGTRKPWPATGDRPDGYLPTTMVGGESLLIPLNLVTGSHILEDGDVIDRSVDWRNRFFRWSAMAISAELASSPGATSTVNPSGASDPTADIYATSMSQSFVADSVTFSAPMVVALQSSFMSNLSGGNVYIIVDSSGRLVLKILGAPNRNIFIWLEASAPFPNAPTS